MSKPKLLVAGNWKMNGLRADLEQLALIKAGIGPACAADVWVFPPATLIEAAAALVNGSALRIGAQDCRAESSGAFTGDISATMIKDAGASAVILGHSERRSLHCETSRSVRLKAAAALKNGLSVILCIGETRGEREAGLALAVCARQLRESLPDESVPRNTIIAYEPVWAIGTGVSPTPKDIAAIHVPLRELLDKRSQSASAGHGWRILYGGSVTPSNAATIFGCGEVDGALVGGASLNAGSFLAIIAAAEQAQQRRRP
jgi:triosephosphate isomerase (TIM)